MPDEPILIQSLTLSGFRAYLESTTFDFSGKRSLAVFGPNGKGKSGLVDGFEFLFSDNGTIERLGLRATHNQGGVTALAHDLAAEKGKPSEVHIRLKQGKTVSEGLRSVAGDRDRPAALDQLLRCQKVDPIIRGFALRHFVEHQTPEDRYTEVASWLQLSPLVEVQKNLRLLRQQIKADAEDERPKAQINAQVAKATARVVTGWNDRGVLAYCNDLLAQLDANLKMASLDRSDPAFAAVVIRAENEEKELGVAGLRQLAVAIEAVYVEKANETSGAVEIKGAIAIFEAAVAKMLEAESVEAAERSRAANAVFAEVWNAAEPLFKDGAPLIDSCPICATPVAETASGSREGIRDHISKHKSELAAYASAKEGLDKAARDAATAHNTLMANLRVLRPLIPEVEEASVNATVTYETSIKQWKDGVAPDSVLVKAALGETLGAVLAKIADIQQRQGENTYVKAQAKIEILLEIKAQEQLQTRIAEELMKLLAALNEQATFISNEIRKKVQALLDLLREPTNAFYKSIQGDSAAPVRLELPPEDETNQQRLALLIDFSPGRQAVPPSGYLSDSQIHSLALALRLAAIRTFNAGAPIAILDDIVTSYDADHRRTIAGMIAEELTDLQVIVTTHDQRFFSYLKDQLPPATWSFTQIVRLEREYGPRFTHHKISDEMIAARWNDGQSAANEMRQAEEEWLLDRCRDFGVNIRIRETDRVYSYERSELALALATYLNGAGLVPPAVPGVSNRFLVSLQKGEIENFGSHFQEGPYGDGSIGDEKARWAEFKYFRANFVCPACKRTKFKRPPALKKPVCAHGKCEVQFAFPAATEAKE
jgi:energy-coupling factor transporter ATP-binding protein EcfA2